MSGWFEVLAPAKVNLRLDVLGLRGDGYHELATAMLAVDLCDRVYARRGSGDALSLRLCGPALTDDVTADGRNLVWRAAVAALDRAAELGRVELDAPLELVVEKHVPSRAGLGGGSADAGAAIRAASAALGFTLEPEERRSLLAELGSDTVFFEAAAHTGHAWCLGRGDRVQPVETVDPSSTVALFVPETGVSTGAVYAALGLAPSERLEPPEPLDDLLEGPLADVRARLFNGLETAACEVEPGLARWRALFDALGLDHVRLSGSGSAWFGLFADRDEAEAALGDVRAGARARGLGLRLARAVRPLGRGLGEPRGVAGPPPAEGSAPSGAPDAAEDRR